MEHPINPFDISTSLDEVSKFQNPNDYFQIWYPDNQIPNLKSSVKTLSELSRISENEINDYRVVETVGLYKWDPSNTNIPNGTTLVASVITPSMGRWVQIVGSGSGGGGTITPVPPIRLDTPRMIHEIAHGLKRYPAITVTDDDRNEVIIDKQYASEDVIVISAAFNFTGWVFLS